jgi:hypothetical protein
VKSVSVRFSRFNRLFQNIFISSDRAGIALSDHIFYVCTLLVNKKLFELEGREMSNSTLLQMISSVMTQ